MYDKADSLWRSVTQDGMAIDWDVPIKMDDGIVLRCDVYRPIPEGKYPVLMTYGPYGKQLHFEQGYKVCWDPLISRFPEVLENSTGKYMNWETVDPEKWIPEGYVVIRVDSRGAGRSPGVIECSSNREIQDYYDCIEWAGVQEWSNGKVGLVGVSYYAANQWRVAALNPPHLAAICPFEGYADHYRDSARHGGIKHDMMTLWYPRQVENIQHGLGTRGVMGKIGDMLVSGPETLSQEELDENRVDIIQKIRDHEWYDDYHRERNADLSKISVPILSCGNWGGNSLHLRGNVEGYLAATGTKDKWLEIHGLEHYTEFYTDYGRGMQKAFFDHFLKGKDTWHQAPVHLRLRNVDGSFTDRDEQEWPLARTQWTKFYLDTDKMALTNELPNGDAKSFEAMGDGLTFTTAPLQQEMEITGPLACKLFASSSTENADIFLTLRVLDPQGKDVTFIAANDPNGLVATGWLRMNHRKLDPDCTLPYRPWHTHDEPMPVVPGETYELDIEIWPTSVIVPKGYQVALTITGKDFELPGDGPWPEIYGIEMRGNGIYVHIDPLDRVAGIFDGVTTVTSKENQSSYLLLPIIPKA